MAKTPEKEEERKRNSPLMNLPVLEEETEGKKMESEIPERAFLSDFPKKSRTPRIKKAGSSTKLAKPESGHEENHSASLEKLIINLDDDNDEEEEELETQIDKKIDSSHWRSSFNMKNQSDSVKKNTILDDDNEEEEEKELETQIAEKYLGLKNKSALGKMNTILDEEEELEKMGSKRRNLDVESTTPQTQIVQNSKIGYSIDGKKLPKPEFGYSIDGEKLSERPQIEEILDIIGDCSKPFEKKLLKYEVDRISFHRNDVKNGILPYLNEDETVKLQKEGILVSTYDEFGNRYEMKFESYNNSFYRLCNGWKRLYKYHGLKEDEHCYVDVWMFRHKENDGICFAVILKR
uniref:B3 domain-containing protein n=1 Tax=Solanum tuberosum TaxID=4113 RepID=M0ZHP8_SOLTU